jgi:hypothetical protein
MRRSGQQGVQHRQDSNGPATTVITFRLRFQANYGQRIRVVGNCEQLGSWDHMHGAEMKWTDGHLWIANVGLPRDTVLEYKFVVLESDGVTPAAWQSGNNAVLPLLVRLAAISAWCSALKLRDATSSAIGLRNATSCAIRLRIAEVSAWCCAIRLRDAPSSAIALRVVESLLRAVQLDCAEC